MGVTNLDRVKCTELVVQNGKSPAIQLRAIKDAGVEINVIGRNSEGKQVNFLALDVAPNGSWKLRMNEVIDNSGATVLRDIDPGVFFGGVPDDNLIT